MFMMDYFIMSRIKIRDGFAGQKYIVIPDSAICRYTKDSPYQQLFVTDISYFRKANFIRYSTPEVK
jgi:hypothetical protein